MCNNFLNEITIDLTMFGDLAARGSSPALVTPEKGEAFLLRALADVEDYAKLLVISSTSIENDLRARLEKSADIAKLALTNHSQMLSEVREICRNEIAAFDALVDAVEAMSSEFSRIDQLYEDVMKLSDMVSNLEHQLRV